MTKKQLFSAEQINSMIQMRGEGLTFAAIAKKFGVVPSTVHSYVKAGSKVINTPTTGTLNSLQAKYVSSTHSCLPVTSPTVKSTKKSLSSKVKSFFTSLIGR